jgi:hypothetical protein
MSKFFEIDQDGLPTYILKKDITRVTVNSRDEDEEPEVQESVTVYATDESGESSEFEVYGPVGYAAAIIMSLNEEA